MLLAISALTFSHHNQTVLCTKIVHRGCTHFVTRSYFNPGISDRYTECDMEPAIPVVVDPGNQVKTPTKIFVINIKKERFGYSDERITSPTANIII